MPIDSDFAAMTKASSLVAEIAESLKTEKVKAQQQIDSLVSVGWSGQAAEQYARAWQDWVDGAERVLEALDAESRLIAAQRDDFLRTDDGVVGEVARLGSRLGPR